MHIRGGFPGPKVVREADAHVLFLFAEEVFQHGHGFRGEEELGLFLCPDAGVCDFHQYPAVGADHVKSLAEEVEADGVHDRPEGILSCERACTGDVLEDGAGREGDALMLVFHEADGGVVVAGGAWELDVSVHVGDLRLAVLHVHIEGDGL